MTKRIPWSKEDKNLLLALLAAGTKWVNVGIQLDRTAESCMSQYKRMTESARIAKSQPQTILPTDIEKIVNDRFLSLLRQEKDTHDSHVVDAGCGNNDNRPMEHQETIRKTNISSISYRYRLSCNANGGNR